MEQVDQRTSGILDDTDQKLAQKLYDLASSQGGVLHDLADDRVVRVEITGFRRRAQSMEVYIGGTSVIETRLRRGRRLWQDDGSRALTAQLGDGSMMAGEEFHPTLEQRRDALRNAVYKFILDQP